MVVPMLKAVIKILSEPKESSVRIACSLSILEELVKHLETTPNQGGLQGPNSTIDEDLDPNALQAKEELLGG